MMKRGRWFDWLLPLLLGLPLTMPLWRWGQVACTHDGHLHYHRVAALKYMWEQGLFFSRWMPDLAFGYGYPFFLYREPLPLYSVLLPHVAGLSLPAASNLFYAVCLLMGGLGMFLWVRDVFGLWSGLVSSMAYMAAPYVLIDALIRGNSPESLGLAVMPWVLWLARRFLLYRTRGAFLGALLGLMVLGLSHNISVLLFAPTLLVYLLGLGWLARMNWRVVVGRTVLLLVLGFGLTVWYTGAAVLELDEVTITQSTTTRNNDFHFNYATLDEIFSKVQPEDRLAINRPLPIRIGWVPVGLAVLGLLSVFWQRGRERRGHVVLMGVAAGLFMLMTLEVTNPLWEALPLIDFVQFPWRFVGRMALPVALLAGVLFADRGVDQPQRRRGLPSEEARSFLGGFILHPSSLSFFSLIAVLLLFLEVVPYLYPTYCDEGLFPTINTVHGYERRSGLVGVDPEGSYFPKSVAVWPRGSVMEEAFLAGDVVERFVGEGVIAAVYEPNRAVVEVESAEGFTAEYLTFYFPGWRVLIDGERVDVRVSEPDGTMLFDVPAGRHTVEVVWGWTTARLVLAGVSGLFGLVALGLAWGMEKKDEPLRRGGRRGLPLEGARSWVGCLVLVLVMFGVLWGLDGRDSWLVRDGAAGVANGGGGLRGSELELVGYNVDVGRLDANGTIDLDLAWLAHSTPGSRYQSAVWLADGDGLIWSDKETFRPRLYEDAGRTDFWLPGHWAWDSHEVRVLPGTPPGTYDIVLNLFEQETLRPLTLTDAAGVRGANPVIGQVAIDGVVGGDFVPQFMVDGGGIVGFDQDRDEARPGDPVLVTVYGAADVGATELQLVDAAGDVVQVWEVAVWDGVRSQILVRLGAGLGGSYQFVLNGRPLGEIAVDEIARVLVRPDDVRPLDVPFDEGITLVGYVVTDGGLKLVWQTDEEIAVSYRVFVHVLDEAGEIVVQSDGEPGGWARPTTSWRPGEFVVDEHVVASDDGVAWRVGLYDGVSGGRVGTVAGEAFVLIGLREGDG